MAMAITTSVISIMLNIIIRWIDVKMVSNNNICRGRALGILLGITALVLLMAGGAGAYVINDNTTGWDCSSIGTWNAVTKTCILTTDLTGKIEIYSDFITLDGNSHTITGSNAGKGINISLELAQ